ALNGLRETEPPTAHDPVTLPPMVAAPGEVWSPPPGHSPDSLDIDAWEPARLTAPAVPVVEDRAAGAAEPVPETPRPGADRRSSRPGQSAVGGLQHPEGANRPPELVLLGDPITRTSAGR